MTTFPISESLARINQYDSEGRKRVVAQALFERLKPSFSEARQVPFVRVNYDEGLYTPYGGTAIVNGGDIKILGIREDGTIDQSFEWYNSPIALTGPVMTLFLDLANFTTRNRFSSRGTSSWSRTSGEPLAEVLDQQVIVRKEDPRVIQACEDINNTGALQHDVQYSFSS